MHKRNSYLRNDRLMTLKTEKCYSLILLLKFRWSFLWNWLFIERLSI